MVGVFSRGEEQTAIVTSSLDLDGTCVSDDRSSSPDAFTFLTFCGFVAVFIECKRRYRSPHVNGRVARRVPGTRLSKGLDTTALERASRKAIDSMSAGDATVLKPSYCIYQ